MRVQCVFGRHVDDVQWNIDSRQYRRSDRQFKTRRERRAGEQIHRQTWFRHVNNIKQRCHYSSTNISDIHETDQIAIYQLRAQRRDRSKKCPEENKKRVVKSDKKVEREEKKKVIPLV